MTLATEKADLRTAALQRRAAMTPDERRLASRRAGEIADELIGPEPGCVALFLPIGTEIDPGALMMRLIERDVTIALPVVRARGKPLLFRQYNPGDALFTRQFGLREPGEDADLATPDLFLVPLAAFDRRCHRVGYGAGYYDLTFGTPAATGKRRIGFAFACQEVEQVPDKPHDAVLDAVVTERGVIRPADAA